MSSSPLGSPETHSSSFHTALELAVGESSYSEWLLKLSSPNPTFILEINWHKLFTPAQRGNYTQTKTIAYKGSGLLCSVPSLNTCNLFSVVRFGLRPFQYTIQQRWGFNILKESVCISNAEWIHYCVHFFQFPHLPLTPDAPRVFLPSQKQIVTWHSFSGFGFFLMLRCKREHVLWGERFQNQLQ